MACLRENVSRLSPRCTALLTNYETSARWRNACLDDAQRLCADQPAEAVAAGACLVAKLSELSASCRIYYSAKKGE